MSQKTAFVDEKLDALVASAPYEGGSIQERKELASQVLSELENNGYIYQLSFDGQAGLFSFQYADRTLGGLQIKASTNRPGELPMN